MKLIFYLLIFSITNYCLCNEIDSLEFQSQCGQDKFILSHFFTDSQGNLKKDGFFIEFGASNGKNISNTWVLEKQLDWQGICVEPIPSLFQQLQQNRSCICINACISDKEGTALFREVENKCILLSGLEDKYDPQHIGYIENVYHASCKHYEVQCYTLSHIFERYNVEKVDFMSVDCEGGELEILKSLNDEELAKIDVICVEDNYKDPEFIRYLESKNFKFICRLEYDIIFRNKKYLH